MPPQKLNKIHKNGILRNKKYNNKTVAVLRMIREFKIYDATVAKTSLKIASSSFSINFVIMSVWLTFES